MGLLEGRQPPHCVLGFILLFSPWFHLLFWLISLLISVSQVVRYRISSLSIFTLFSLLLSIMISPFELLGIFPFSFWAHQFLTAFEIFKISSINASWDIVDDLLLQSDGMPAEHFTPPLHASRNFSTTTQESFSSGTQPTPQFVSRIPWFSSITCLFKNSPFHSIDFHYFCDADRIYHWPSAFRRLHQYH